MIDKLIFYPRKNISSYADLWEHSKLSLNINHQNLQGWFVKSSTNTQSPLIIYYGGNAEDISINLSYLQPNSVQSNSWLLVNYRGFGKSTGKPSQTALFSDALAIYDFVVNVLEIPPTKIYLMGRSIGSSIASYVASQRDIAGLILVTPFDSILNFAPRFLRISVFKTYLEKYFNTQQYLEKVQVKFLIIAAGDDEVIPKSHLEKLLNKFKDQITYLEIPHANHQNIAEFPEYELAIEKYIHSTTKEHL